MSWNPRSCRSPLAGLVLILAVAAAPRPGLATTARLTSLGGGDFIEDDHNVQRWYGSLGDYPNLVVLEAGHFTLPEGWHDAGGDRVSGPGIGLHLTPDEAGSWGTAALFVNGQGDAVDPGGLARDRMGTTWTAMWSRRFGRLQPALMYRHGADSGEDAVVPGASATAHRSWDRARTEWGGGLRWDISDGAYLDLAGELRRHREQVTLTDTTMAAAGADDSIDSSNSSHGSYGLRARAFVRLSPTTALVPTLEFVRDDRVLPAPLPLQDPSLDGHLFKVGAGLNWYPDADHLLVVGLDYVTADVDHLAAPPDGPATVDETRTWDSLAWTLGFESRFQYWLTFRGSVRYEPVRFGNDTGTGEADFAAFRVNLGAAIQVADYDLDLAVTDQEPRSVAGYYGHSLLGNPATWLTISLRRTF